MLGRNDTQVRDETTHGQNLFWSNNLGRNDPIQEKKIAHACFRSKTNMDSQQLNELLACANLQGYHKEMIDMGNDDVPHILNMSPHDTNILCEDIFGSKRVHR